MDRGDPSEEPLDSAPEDEVEDDLDDDPTPAPGSARDVDYWDVEEALDLDAFDEVDGEAGVCGSVVDGDDPEAVDTRNRERMTAALDADRVRNVRIAAEQAAQAGTLARAAEGWACPHQHQVDTDPDEWAKDSHEWVRHHGDRMKVSGIHDGLFGICWESIEGAAKVLSAQRPAMTLGWARGQITNSIRLTRTLPLTLTAWAQGQLDARQVGVIVRCTRTIHDPALLAQVDVALSGPGDTALTLTLTLTTGALPPRISEVLASLDIQVATETSRRQAASRSVRFHPDTDGHARIVLEGPAPALAEIYEAIKAAGLESRSQARRRNKAGLLSLDPWALTGIDDDHQDHRGIDAHRFDATHTLILGAITGLATGDSNGTAASDPSSDETSGDAGGQRDHDAPREDLRGCVGQVTSVLAARWAALSGLASVQLPAVLVGLTTLLGEDQCPARLDGYGPLSPWMTRAMARSRELRRFVTDSLTGELIHQDRHAYPPGYLNGIQPEDPPEEPPDEPGGDDDGGGPGGGDPPSGGPTPPAPGGSGCVPLDPEDCPLRQIGDAATAAGTPGARPSGNYIPSVALAAFVRRRWGHCTAPGCRRRAAACELDHTIAWPVGTTCACDLAPLCETHHASKHNSPHYGGGPSAAYAARSGTLPWKWSLHRCTQGHQHWRDPLGTEHIVTAPPPLGTPVTDDQTPRMTSPPTPLRYPRPAPALPAPRPTQLTDPWTPSDQAPPF